MIGVLFVVCVVVHEFGEVDALRPRDGVILFGRMARSQNLYPLLMWLLVYQTQLVWLKVALVMLRSLRCLVHWPLLLDLCHWVSLTRHIQYFLGVYALVDELFEVRRTSNLLMSVFRDWWVRLLHSLSFSLLQSLVMFSARRNSVVPLRSCFAILPVIVEHDWFWYLGHNHVISIYFWLRKEALTVVRDIIFEVKIVDAGLLPALPFLLLLLLLALMESFFEQRALVVKQLIVNVHLVAHIAQFVPKLTVFFLHVGDVNCVPDVFRQLPVLLCFPINRPVVDWPGPLLAVLRVVVIFAGVWISVIVFFDLDHSTLGLGLQEDRPEWIIPWNG